MAQPSRKTEITLDSSVGVLRGVGPARERELRTAGFETLRDLSFHLPRRYEDRRHTTPLAAVEAEGVYTVRGYLESVSTVRLYRRRMTLVRARLIDGMDSLPLTWFSRPYLANQIKSGEEYLLHGEVRLRQKTLGMVNPSLERVAQASLGGRVVPVYSAIGGLGPSLVRTLMRTWLAVFESLADSKIYPIPRPLREKHSLPSYRESLIELHRPADDANVSALNRSESRAHSCLAYGELLRLQTELAIFGRDNGRRKKEHTYRRLNDARSRLTEALPFRLTGAQERCLDEISLDLADTAPMMRLLQGDVGSGKTAVAAVALGCAVESGLQGALMAPTELLAEQHFGSLRAVLGDRIRIDLFTSGTSSGDLRAKLADGSVQVAVGTHALFQSAVDFQALGLVVIDEQHRFGVAQRRALTRKGEFPDLLIMTATPIPRSLMMTVYGDLAASVIDELPPGRVPVATSVVFEEDRDQVYRELALELEQGNKAFVVLPLIEESDRVAAEAIDGLGSMLMKRLEPYRPLVLHGRMESEVRAETMAEFQQGECQVLIATTLIEVGVDVPEATVMIVESAERFGLSQLHQLRGRVGRGTKPSRCVAVCGGLTDEARTRLEVFERTLDGFAIAEADLEIRGPGDLLGTRQAGFPKFRVADLSRHRTWIEKARQDARQLVEKEPEWGTVFLNQCTQTLRRSDELAGG